MPNGIRKISLLPEEEVTIIPAIPRSAVPRGAKPTIPKDDPCCTRTCTILNSEVDALQSAINIRTDEISYTGLPQERSRIRRQLRSLTDQITALKDLRYTLKEKGSCACIE